LEALYLAEDTMSDQPAEPVERPSLKEIEVRHLWDRWKDASFIAVAVLLTALSIGAVTSQAVGKSISREWSVMAIDGQTGLELGK
jgi:hypothetical protein